jgi:ribonuclease T2
MTPFPRATLLALASCALALAQFHLPGAGSSDSSPKPAPKTIPNTTPQTTPSVIPSKPATFDYYVLALSWAPNFCALPGNAAAYPNECAAGRNIGFIVGGLWPQANEGPAPESCGSPKSPSRGLLSLVLPLMMSETRIRDEWKKHGSCTGLTAGDYFTEIRQARSEVQIPVQMTALEDNATETPLEIETQFASANPDFPPGAFRIACNLAELTEVHVCFDRDLKPRPCAASVTACGAARLAIKQPR